MNIGSYQSNVNISGWLLSNQQSIRNTRARANLQKVPGIRNQFYERKVAHHRNNTFAKSTVVVRGECNNQSIPNPAKLNNGYPADGEQCKLLSARERKQRLENKQPSVCSLSLDDSSVCVYTRQQTSKRETRGSVYQTTRTRGLKSRVGHVKTSENGRLYLVHI